MSKSSGLGDNLYVDGRNLSGDIGSIGTIGGGNSPLEVTGIDKSAMERLGGLRDGRIEYSSFFNPSSDQAHDTLSTLPTSDRIVTYFRGTALGNAAASLVAKQIGYDPSRGADGALTIAGTTQGNGFGLEWGKQLTDGIRSDTGADTGDGLDAGASSSFGLQAYLHVFSFTGTDVTIKLQQSSDDGSGDAYADVAGGAFTGVASAPASQRIATDDDQTVEQWLRVATSTSGGFSEVSFAVMVVRNVSTPEF